MARRYEKTGRKGHGCCGTIVALFLVLTVVVTLLLFTTDVLDNVKRHFMEKAFPLEYSEYVTEYSSQYGVEEALVYSVMRTESGFRAEVESSAGAVGLMQMMPSTFEWLQNKKDGEVIYDKEDLKNPQISIEYGTYLLSYLLDRYEDEATAIAAYNAGMTTVDGWLSDTMYSKDSITLSNIPYPETAQYVERVEKTKSVYESLYYENTN